MGAKLESLTLNFWGSIPTGQINISDSGTTVYHTLTTEEVNEFVALAHDIAQRKKEAVAQAILAMEKPPALEAPKHSIEGDA